MASQQFSKGSLNPFSYANIAATVTTHTKKEVETNKNIPYYLTAAGILILPKPTFTLADNNDLTFLIKPTSKLVGFLTGSHSFYLSYSGYFHKHLNIIIDKSCSGFNFSLFLN